MIELLHRRPGRSLVVVLLAAALLVAAWVRYVGVTTTTVAAGQTGTSAGVSWRLDSFTANRGYTNEWGDEETPLAGTSYVIARITYEAIDAEKADCQQLWLLGAGREWPSTRLPYPTSEDFEVNCDVGGTVEAIFEVPTSALPEVTGVRIATGPGMRVVLQGRLPT